MAARRRGRTGRPADGQHFLRSPRVAAEVVAAAGIESGELVLEIGAGSGRLTEALRGAGARVCAVELDPALADVLRHRFAHDPQVAVICGDALVVELPAAPHRVVGNLPFGISTAILRRLLDAASSPLTGADLIVQDGLARKRCSPRPCTMLSLSWAPWWRLSMDRRLPAGCFEPRPSVDAAVMAVRRRDPPLLSESRAGAYRAVLRRAFDRADGPLRRAVPIPPRAWKRLARERGLAFDARPQHLDVWDWVAVYEACGRSG